MVRFSSTFLLHFCEVGFFVPIHGLTTSFCLKHGITAVNWNSSSGQDATNAVVFMWDYGTPKSVSSGRACWVFRLNSKRVSFLFTKPTSWGQYAFVAVRIAIAAFWVNSDIPRWVVLAAGHPQANGLVRNLFGPGIVEPLTSFFTILMTLGAIALILGLLTRLASVWAVVEFAITGIFGVLAGNAGIAKDFGLFAPCKEVR
jgi:uncharacterized membrane protein YphA (DoxX/SURF4 family)